MKIEGPIQTSLEERNTHLWAFLTGLGLVVSAVRFPDDEIDCFIVSLTPPKAKLHLPAEFGVGSPMKGDEVIEPVGTAESRWPNVVDFPTKF